MFTVLVAQVALQTIWDGTDGLCSIYTAARHLRNLFHDFHVAFHFESIHLENALNRGRKSRWLAWSRSNKLKVTRLSRRQTRTQRGQKHDIYQSAKPRVCGWNHVNSMSLPMYPKKTSCISKKGLTICDNPRHVRNKQRYQSTSPCWIEYRTVFTRRVSSVIIPLGWTPKSNCGPYSLLQFSACKTCVHQTLLTK